MGMDEAQRIAALKAKTETLKKYGGRMVVRGRCLTMEFDTKEGERAYWAMIRKKAFAKAGKFLYNTCIK